MSPCELELLPIGKFEAEVTLRDQLICANASPLQSQKILATSLPQLPLLI